jgi:hypothetical protein
MKKERRQAGVLWQPWMCGRQMMDFVNMAIWTKEKSFFV